MARKEDFVMENIMDHLKLSELKQDSLHKSFDEARVQASSIMSFSLQWKELEDEFQLTRNLLLKLAKKLDVQEKKLMSTSEELDEREKAAQIKLKRIEDCFDEVQTKEKELGCIRTRIHECVVELDSKEKQLNLVREEADKCNGELTCKREQLLLVKKDLEDCNDKLETRIKKLDAVQKSIERCTGELVTRETNMGLLKRDLEGCSQSLDVRHEQLAPVHNSLEDSTKQLDLRKEELSKVENFIKYYNGKLDLKEQELLKLENLIKDSNVELELKKEELHDVEDLINVKENKLEVLQELIKTCSDEMDLRQNKLDLVQESTGNCLKDLELKRMEQDRVQKSIEESQKGFDLKQKDLRGIWQLMQKDLYLNQLHLDSIKLLLEEYTGKLEHKGKPYNAVSRYVDECYAKIKKTELELIEKPLKECLVKLDSEEKILHSIQKKREDKKELNSAKETLKQYTKDIELKERELNAIQLSIEDRCKELESKDELLKSTQIAIEECSKVLVAMEEQQNSLQQSILDCHKELESKQRNLASVRTSLEEIYDELASKEAERNCLDVMCCEYSRKLQAKTMHFALLKKTIEASMEKLQMKEKHHEHQVKDLELKTQQLSSLKKLQEECQKRLLSKEKQLSKMIPLSESLEQPKVLQNAIHQCCIGGNGSGLLMLFNYHSWIHDWVLHQTSKSIAMSPDPAKLVLETMKGFYPPTLKIWGMEFELGVSRRSCITFLDELLKISPQIKPEVREDALKLAMEWKTKMMVLQENSVEVLGFLKLVAVFQLSSAFRADELQKLLDTITEHKQAHELQQAFVMADLHGSNHMSAHVNIEHSEHLQVNPTFSSSERLQPATVVNEWHSQLPNDHVGEHNLTHDEVLSALKLSPDPAKLVVHLMQGYFQSCENGISTSDECGMGNIGLLLEQLIKILPKVSLQVKGEALELAKIWKEIITKTENLKEVLAFLIFLAVYMLVSFFREDEIFRLFETVTQFKQAPQICRALGFAERIPDFIPVLIQRNQLLEAARFSCEFGLTSKFAPKQLLKSYLENIWREVRDPSVGETSLEAQCNAIDKEIAAVVAIFECVTDYKLESIIAREKMIARIAVLGKRKARTISESAHRVHLPGQSHNQDVIVAADSVDGQLHGSSKRPRIDASADRPQSVPSATSMNMNQSVNLASWTGL